MPFKTRKQKVAAASRSFSFSEGKVIFEGVKSQKAPVEESSLGRGNGQISAVDENLLKVELVKIIAISLLVISAQIGLRLTLF